MDKGRARGEGVLAREDLVSVLSEADPGNGGIRMIPLLPAQK